MFPAEAGHTLAGAVMVLDGGVRMLTVTLPEDPPGQVSESEREETVYVVLVAGETVRIAGLEATAWTMPSDQVRDHGPTPVKAA